MLSRHPILLRSDLFHGLDKARIEELADTAQFQIFAPDERIIAEGQQASFVYCVMRGFVRLSKSESAGRQADICICEPGETFGEYLLSGGGSYTYSAWSADGAEVALFDLVELRALADRDPVMRSNVMRIMARHLLGAMDCIAGDRLHTAAQRVANYLVSRCPASASQATFRLPYRKRILAGKLGVAPEALSRAFAALGPAGVEVRGRVVVVDSVDLLRKAC
ncbi:MULTISPECIES: Crp/Fnr family transcriptional regulator [Rhizobium]|uniref:Crp/Fnr family transcriptional regulator n=1 Tax=Rhizobium phaseoli TaxID=396 RepID=UPI000A1C1254|nr:Crp/Fnr family transcriptional regulator [Rhizobium phaseoli]ARM14936.1 Crp family transcriptional regulator protein [Rhizobium phaseoli Brasil 5]